MITLTASMHISKQKNALATTIDTIQLMAKVFSAIDSSQSFTIKKQTLEGENNTYINKIKWADHTSRINFQNHEVWLIHDDTTEIHHPGKQSTAITPVHETAALFATPERLKNQLMGKWKIEQLFPLNKTIEITIENLREGYTIHLWVDPITHLPTQMNTTAAERPGGGIITWQNIHMDFSWNQPVDSSTLRTVNKFEGEE
jgi:hypothetical protein